MPNAVKVVGDVKLDMEVEIDGERTEVIKDFLAVDYHQIFVNNVGATQQLALLLADLEDRTASLETDVGLSSEVLTETNMRVDSLEQTRIKLLQVDKWAVQEKEAILAGAQSPTTRYATSPIGPTSPAPAYPSTAPSPTVVGFPPASQHGHVAHTR